MGGNNVKEEFSLEENSGDEVIYLFVSVLQVPRAWLFKVEITFNG
jgi:hypothetical protein